MGSLRDHRYATYGRLAFGGLAFYFVWFACAWGAANGRPLIGPTLVFGSICMHLLLSPQRLKDLVIIGIVTSTGFVIDSSYGWTGVLGFASYWETYPWLCPIWLASLYALFGMTVDHSMAWLQKNLFAAAILGAGGGITSYMAGERMGAIDFLLPGWSSPGIIGGVWLLYCPFVCYISRRIHRYFGWPRH